jgi:hypothetical protein
MNMNCVVKNQCCQRARTVPPSLLLLQKRSVAELMPSLVQATPVLGRLPANQMIVWRTTSSATMVVSYDPTTSKRNLTLVKAIREATREEALAYWATNDEEIFQDFLEEDLYILQAPSHKYWLVEVI